MNIKKFIGNSTSEVMQLVRDEFGRDAIIVSNRQTSEGVEIVAADDLSELEAGGGDFQTSVESALSGKNSGNRKARNPVGGSKKNRKTAGKTVSGHSSSVKGRAKGAQNKGGTTTSFQNSLAAASGAAIPAGGGVQVQNQLYELRTMLEDLARTSALANSGDATEITLTSRLLATGLSAMMVRQLLESVTPISNIETAWQQALSNLLELLPVPRTDADVASGDLIEQGGAVFIHGRPGAGKSTVVCKLAASFLATGSASKLALISCQHGSLRQSGGLLDTFSTMLRVPVQLTESEEELHEVVRGFRHKKLILIDTDSMTDEVLANPQLLTGGDLKRSKVHHCLVMPASLQATAMDFQLGCLAESVVQNVIVSRLDETYQPGIVMESLIRSGLRLLYCSTDGDLHNPLDKDITKQLQQQLTMLNVQPPRGLSGAPSISDLVGISTIEGNDMSAGRAKRRSGGISRSSER